MKRLLYISLFLFISVIYLYSSGVTGGQMLKLGMGAKSAGLANTFLSVSDDPSAIYYNPAGITQNLRPNISLTHMNRIVDILSFDVSTVFPLSNKKEALGCGGYVLYSKDIIREEETGNELGHFMNYNTYIILTYAKEITPKLSLGFNTKFVYILLQDFQSSNTAIDISALYTMSNKLIFGFVIQNISTGLKFTNEVETIPLGLKLGAVYKFTHMTIAFDICKYEDAGTNFGVGVEYLLYPKIVKNFAIRTGYRYKPENFYIGGLTGFSFGFGLEVGKYQIDYAYTPYGTLENLQNRLSISRKF
jgi:hypothetical protein